jgi:hypothetical protein
METFELVYSEKIYSKFLVTDFTIKKIYGRWEYLRLDGHNFDRFYLN